MESHLNFFVLFSLCIYFLSVHSTKVEGLWIAGSMMMMTMISADR